ncbi:MAG: hypothetical protein AB1592_02890 [Pseudomonadota bacterium]
MRLFFIACALIISPLPALAQSASETFAFVFMGLDPSVFNQPGQVKGDFSQKDRGVNGSEILQMNITRPDAKPSKVVIKMNAPCKYLVHEAGEDAGKNYTTDYVIDLTDFKWDDLSYTQGGKITAVNVDNVFREVKNGVPDKDIYTQIYQIYTSDRPKLDKAIAYFKAKFCSGRAF